MSRPQPLTPDHTIFSDGTGYFRWLGESTWVHEYDFLRTAGRQEERKNYRVYTNYPAGFPRGRKPWTVANRQVSIEPLLTLEAATAFARTYEAEHPLHLR